MGDTELAEMQAGGIPPGPVIRSTLWSRCLGSDLRTT